MTAEQFRNYSTTALRFLAKQPLYSAINIAGLALGLSCCILILLFVRDELSYDRWLPNADRIYRVESTFIVPGREPMLGAQAPGPARDALQKDYGAELEHVVRVMERRPTISIDDRRFNDLILEADADFFRVFELEFVAGDPGAALSDNLSMALSESMAQKYFGTTQAVGRTLTMTREEPETFRVTGVFRDLPKASHLEAGIVIRFDPEHYIDEPWVTQQWTSTNTYIYTRFKPGVDASRIEADLKAFTDRNVNFDIPDLKDIRPSDVMSLNLQPVPRIHLYSAGRSGLKPGGDIVTVYAFSAVAGLVLLIACINFMNLSTARSLQRAREVSMRKVLGASRRQLIFQYLGESLLMTAFAMLLAVIVVQAALPWFNTYVDKPLAFNPLAEPLLALQLLGVLLLTSVLGGAYPALVVSGFRPAVVLKANQASTAAAGSGRFRAMLVVVQFAISIGLIALTLVIHAQTSHALNMSPGYAKENLLTIARVGRDTTRPMQEALVTELSRIPGVVSVARASDSIPQGNNNNTIVDVPEASAENLLVIETFIAGYTFFDTLGIKPVAGRLFTPDHPADVMVPDADEVPEDVQISAGVVLNQSAVKQLALGDAQSAIGKTFRTLVSNDRKGDMTVVGVVDDMHFRSIHNKITPMIYFLGDHVDDFSFLMLRLKSGDLPQTLREIDAAWDRLIPDAPIRRDFVSEEFAALYRAEQERMHMFTAFSVLAIVVACLGLYGLAAFSTERRTREIGIRKVLGARERDIVSLLLWQFSRPVLIANLIAWPTAWYFMQSWLNGFQYRVDLTPLPFIAASGLALVIAAATIVNHTRRVSRAHPAAALRYE